MKKARAAALSVALLTPCLLLPAGCGVSQGTEAPATQSAPTQAPPVAGSVGSISLSPAYVALHPGDKVQFTLSGAASSSVTWLVDGIQGGNASLGTIDGSGHYTAPAALAQSANFTITAELASSPQKNNATSVASVINYGNIYPTANPQVMEYSIYLPVPGQVSVDFGPSSSYGRDTSPFTTPTPYGGQVNVLVAGMLAKTLYHMQAQVTLRNGATWSDADHDEFASGLPLTTGSPPQTSPINITSSGSPQSGIEMWDTLLPNNLTQVFATDLQGNVIWTYTYQGSQIDDQQGIQLLPNGDLLTVISYLSSLTASAASLQPNTINVVREIDLAGNTVREISMDSLNQKLAAAGFHDSDGSPYQLKSFHHNVLALPNGHWVLLTAYPKTFTNLPGHSGTVGVLGDVLVDVDQNNNPDWVWSTFDHLDINRQPMNFPDWTHSNYMLYSSDDHNILLSIRHQNWIIKIDFNDGQGSGNVLWRLGEGGDFKLVGGTDPTDWFYAQHGMSYFSPNTTGVFRLGMMDNGNDRIFPTGQVQCKPQGPTTPQCYSTFPIFEINEGNMTATLMNHYEPTGGASDFSFFGGDVQQLANGDLHVDFCSPLTGALVQELDPAGSHVIWQATSPGYDQFRADRWPSLYPGVQW